MQGVAQLTAVNVKINVALFVVIARIKSKPRIVNRCPRRIRAITYRSVSRENPSTNFFSERSIIAAHDYATMIIRAAAQASPILHVVYPEIIFLAFRNFDFNLDFGRIVLAVSKCHRINIDVDKIWRKEIGRKHFGNSLRNHLINGSALLRDAHNLRGIICANFLNSPSCLSALQVIKLAHFFLSGGAFEIFKHIIHSVERIWRG